MHILLDYDDYLPKYVNITDGKTDDNKGAYDIPLFAFIRLNMFVKIDL